MTGLELQIAFGTELYQNDDKISVLSDDIFFWLNKAQNRFIYSMFTGMNAKRDSFEQSEEVIDAIRILFKTDNLPQDAILVNSIIGNIVKAVFSLPDDYLWTVAIAAKDEGDNFTECKYVLSDKLYAILKDPFNRPNNDSHLYSIQEGKIVVYHTNVTVVDSIDISYIRVPTDITRVDGCELPEFLHYQIVELAVKLFLEKQSQNNNS